ncbi:MAG: hypothetical protein P4L34_00020 [Paludibacter sp.]|nr:hypothetical protein [Paludibacter sp.]
MSKITIYISGVAAELVLGNYMPKDATIFNNWEEFFHYNDLLHESQLLMEHISAIEIRQDDAVVFTGKIPAAHIREQKSSSPVLVSKALYLRTECAEQAVYTSEFQVESFDKNKLFFETQDHGMLFKTSNSFLSKVIYDDRELPLEWVSGKPIGNICLLCRFDHGYLVPVYDAVKKTAKQ